MKDINELMSCSGRQHIMVALRTQRTNNRQQPQRDHVLSMAHP